MRIVVDNREPESLINILSTAVEQRYKNITIETANLTIGDFQIFKTNSPVPDIIIERKSINDLLASIKDGRYNEQSFRLDKYDLHNHNIYYIIEGLIDKINNEQNRQIVYSSIFTLGYFKGFSVLNSYNINQTCEFVLRFTDKLDRETNKRDAYYLEDNKNTTKMLDDKCSKEKNNDDKDNNKDDDDYEDNKDNKDNKEKPVKDTNYSSFIKSAKKSNITKLNILEIMLMQIPGVSSKIAQSINSKYKTMQNLIASLEKDETCLNNMCFEDSKRKIASTTIKNIVDFLS